MKKLAGILLGSALITFLYSQNDNFKTGFQIESFSIHTGSFKTLQGFNSFEKYRTAFPENSLLQREFSGMSDFFLNHPIRKGRIIYTPNQSYYWSLNAGFKIPEYEKITFNVQFTYLNNSVFLASASNGRLDSKGIYTNNQGQEFPVEVLTMESVGVVTDAHHFMLGASVLYNHNKDNLINPELGMGFQLGFSPFSRTNAYLSVTESFIIPNSPLPQSTSTFVEGVSEINRTNSIIISPFFQMIAGFSVKPYQNSRFSAFYHFVPTTAIYLSPKLGTDIKFGHFHDFGLRYHLGYK
jgi:hypothetical protein